MWIDCTSMIDHAPKGPVALHCGWNVLRQRQSKQSRRQQQGQMNLLGDPEATNELLGSYWHPSFNSLVYEIYQKSPKT